MNKTFLVFSIIFSLFASNIFAEKLENPLTLFQTYTFANDTKPKPILFDKEYENIGITPGKVYLTLGIIASIVGTVCIVDHLSHNLYNINLNIM